LVKVEFTAAALEFSQEADKVLQAAAQSIYRPSGDHIHFTANDCPVQPVKPWPLLAAFGPADPFVTERRRDRPTMAQHCFGQRQFLVGNGLIFSTDP
jgi:hypothetical protein